MGRKVEFTWKQERQIIAFFENCHQFIVDPNNIDNSGVIAVFRALRDYCRKAGGCIGFGKKRPTAEEKAKYRQELIDRLDMLAIRYYLEL